MAELNPMGLALGAAGLLAYQLYLSQQPTHSDSLYDDSVATQRVNNRQKTIILDLLQGTGYGGYNKAGDNMLKEDRSANAYPRNWDDCPDFKRYMRSHPTRPRGQLGIPVDTPVGADARSARMQAIYEKEFLPHHGHAIAATLDTVLLGNLAQNQRKLSELMSGRSGAVYVHGSENQPMIIRKRGSARFAPYQNPIDDSPYTVDQQGISRMNPDITLLGKSSKYHQKSAANDGPFNQPTRQAPSRYEAPGIRLASAYPTDLPRVPASAFKF